MTHVTVVTPKLIAELRARTDAGMMDCKKALEEAGGDLDKATEILRKKNTRQRCWRVFSCLARSVATACATLLRPARTA